VTTHNSTIFKLLSQGMSVGEIAETLTLDEDIVQMAVDSLREPAKEVTIEELVAKYRPTAVRVLAEIMQFGENESARVKAAQILVEGKGQLPEIQSEKYGKTFEAMRRVLENYEKKNEKTKIIDRPSGSGMMVLAT
jgi:hypothetical protein